MIKHITAPAGEIYWRYEPAPRGIKCDLLSIGGCKIPGPATGEWGVEYIAWMPLARRNREIERQLGFAPQRTME